MPGRRHADSRREWDLPSLRETFILESEVGADLEDAKFYPWTRPGLDPILAICNITHVLVLRMPVRKSEKVEVIQAIHDDSSGAGNNSLAWSKTRDGTPLLCIAGRDAKIKIINALTGALVQTLVGHGGGINDLVVSPVNPLILASASEDLTVRIWSLEAQHAAKPCAAILAGGAHQAVLLSIAFHPSARYLLSSGDDQAVNLWTLPELPNQNTGTDNPDIIHYPHFSSSEVHSYMVDCVAFYGDLIMSKATAEECIVLWSINGFDSSKPPPLPSAAPTNHDNQRDTRSAFSPASKPQYTRLAQFAIPDCIEIYMRFSIYSPLITTTDHPVLAVCNSKSEVMFWDLARLTEYYDFIKKIENNPSITIAKPPWLSYKIGPRKEKDKDQLKRIREVSHTESVDSHRTASTETLATENTELTNLKLVWHRKYTVGGSTLVPEQDEDGNISTAVMVEPHKRQTIPKYSISGRQVTWSVGGEWCVIAGSPNVVAVFQRWEDLSFD